MKFLITGRLERAPIPPDRGAALLQAAKEWVNARIADGTIECHYVFPEGGGFTISNADSHEAVRDALLDYPLYPFMFWEVKPLCDWSQSYDKYIELYKKVAG